MGKVLVVDDSDFDRLMIIKALEQNVQNVQVFEVGSGREALENLETLSPDVIVLDIRMPGMDGFQVLCALRKTPKVCKKPVIMLSGSADERDILQAEKCGASEYFVKPASITAYSEIAQTIHRKYLKTH